MSSSVATASFHPPSPLYTPLHLPILGTGTDVLIHDKGKKKKTLDFFSFSPNLE